MFSTEELTTIIKQIEDNLVSFLELDTYEKSLYYHLFRHSRLIGKEDTIFVISNALQKVGLTEFSARDRIRKLDKKGCIKIKEVTRDGILAKIFLPHEIDGCIIEEKVEEIEIDIEKADFYNTPELRLKILEREKNNPVSYSDKRKVWYKWNKRAKAVGIKPLPAGKPTKGQRKEWEQSIIRAEEG